MKISAICFDLGKVLLDFDWQIMLERIAKKSPLLPAQMAELLKTDEKIVAYEIGGVTSARFFAHLKKRLRFTGTARRTSPTRKRPTRFSPSSRPAFTRTK
jgi:FMN phosphatase YigB (HAD superfamily)